MIKKHLSIFLFSIIILSFSCKSEFEKIRISGDSDLLYKKAQEYYKNEDYQKAQTLYELVLANLRGKSEAEGVYFKYAYTFYHMHNFSLASYYFKDFSNKFVHSEFREEADYMVPYSNYKLSPSHLLDQTHTLKSIDEFQLFINTYPTSDRVAKANKLINEMRRKLEIKSFNEGELYFDLQQYEAATQSFENYLKDYPDSKDAVKVKYLIIKAAHLYAKNSIRTKQFERYSVVKEKAERFLEKSKKARYKKEVRKILSTTNKKLKLLNNA